MRAASLSRSASHVRFESSFELTALMVLDFGGRRARSQLEPVLVGGHAAQRLHATHRISSPVCADGSTLVIDVKPKDRIRQGPCPASSHP